MVVREAGILYRGFTLVSSNFHKTGEEIDKDLRSSLMTAIINFAENAFTATCVEYLEGRKYVIAFKEKRIKSKDNTDTEPIFGYVILDKAKRVDKYIQKQIEPLLTQILTKFISLYDGKYLSETSQFKSFSDQINESFKFNNKTLDQRLRTIL